MLNCEGCREELLALLRLINNHAIAAAAIIGVPGKNTQRERELNALKAEMIRPLVLVEEWMADHGHADAAARIHTLCELVRTSTFDRPDNIRAIRDRSNELKEWATGK